MDSERSKKLTKHSLSHSGYYKKMEVVKAFLNKGWDKQ